MRAIGYFCPNILKGNGHGSLEELKTAFLEYCELNLHQPVEAFGDNVVPDSGKQPAYQRMIDYIRDSGSNFLVVVPDARHLGSELETVARAVVALELSGTKVTCYDEEFPDPLQNAFQTLGVKGVSRTRSDRIKQSMRERALRGQGLGKPPYGYHNGASGVLEVVREEAAVVELIYRLYTRDGIGLRLIAQHMNDREITTRRGGNWNMVTIRDILKNPSYMGTYTRFGLRLPKAHEAIIPPDLFRTAQDLTRKKRPVGRVVNAEPFLLSGLLFCGYCNNTMMGVTRRQSWKRKDGRRAKGVYRYYQCQSRNNQSRCAYHTWRAPLLEGTVTGQLKLALKARALESGIDSPAKSREDVQAVWDDRVRKGERRLLQAIRRAARGELTMTTLGKYLDELDNVRKGRQHAAEPTDVSDVLERWNTLDFAQRQAFLQEHITRVEVSDETVEVSV